MNMSIRVIFVLASCVILSFPTKAEPTVEKTLNFINQKFKDYRPSTHDIYGICPVETVTVVVPNIVITCWVEDRQRHDIYLDMRYMKKVSGEKWNQIAAVTFLCIDGEKCLLSESRYLGNGSTEVYKSNLRRVFVSELDAANRISRAFTHLISLHAYLTKKKELF